MHWMDFVLDLAELSIWPFTLIICLYLLRAPLSLLLPFAQSVKFKDFEMQFSQELDHVANHALDALPNLQTLNAEQELKQTAQHLPNHSILMAWSNLDFTARHKLQAFDSSIEIPQQQAYKFVGQKLLDKKLITAKQAKLFHELRQLRNKVAHAEGYDVNTLLAKQYIQLCLALSEQLRSH